MSDGRRGMPLLSGPPPSHTDSSRAEIACRKCSKEFNMLFTRRSKCNHCGYSYCSSCSDFQALMPRAASEGSYDITHTGYQVANVCAFCIDNLNITAAGRGQLRAQPLSRLRKYVEAYNIKVDGVIEKDDFIDHIIKARGANGCLSHANEEFYRKYSVPNRNPGTRPRGLFSRLDPTQSPPQPVPTPRPVPDLHQTQRPEFARPDLEPDHPPPPPPPRQYQPPPGRPPPSQVPRNPASTFNRPDLDPDSNSQYRAPSAPPSPRRSSSASTPRPLPQQVPYQPRQPSPRSQHAFPGSGARPHGHPPPPRPSSAQDLNVPHPSSPPSSRQTPRTRAASAAPPPTPTPASIPSPPPTLDALLNLRPEGIKALSISTLKAILFQNHVNARLILEKSDLVEKVVTLIEDERRDRERKAREEEEQAMESQRVLMEERRAREWEASRMRGEQSESTDHDMDVDGDEDSGKPLPLPPKAQVMAATLERTGLCVICQDEEANIAIVDCGHLAMCRACSDLIMTSSRECPLCRTRIVTEARLLRIYKS